MGKTTRKHFASHINREVYADYWATKWATRYYIRGLRGRQDGAVTYEEEFEYHLREYDRMCRGRLNETGRNRAFKEMCRKHDRAKTRMALNKVLRDEETYYEMDFPDRKDGKKFIWSVW